MTVYKLLPGETLRDAAKRISARHGDRATASDRINTASNHRFHDHQEALIAIGEALFVGDVEGVLLAMRSAVGTHEALEHARSAARLIDMALYDDQARPLIEKADRGCTTEEVDRMLPVRLASIAKALDDELDLADAGGMSFYDWFALTLADRDLARQLRATVLAIGKACTREGPCSCSKEAEREIRTLDVTNTGEPRRVICIRCLGVWPWAVHEAAMQTAGARRPCATWRELFVTGPTDRLPPKVERDAYSAMRECPEVESVRIDEPSFGGAKMTIVLDASSFKVRDSDAVFRALKKALAESTVEHGRPKPGSETAFDQAAKQLVRDAQSIAIASGKYLDTIASYFGMQRKSEGPAVETDESLRLRLIESLKHPTMRGRDVFPLSR